MHDNLRSTQHPAVTACTVVWPDGDGRFMMPQGRTVLAKLAEVSLSVDRDVHLFV